MKPAIFVILALSSCAVVQLSSLHGQSDSKDVGAGKDVFEAQCINCHNADSTEAKDGPGLKGVKDGKLPSGKAATRDTILDLINKGSDAMPAFKETLTNQQKENVVAYVLTL
jgi:mono/diheme cytochrome c family protein